MTENSEALRLAELLETSLVPGVVLSNKCATMLRKLSAENKLLHERHSFDNDVLKELLKALEDMVEHGDATAFSKARAVIAKVKGS